ncbi:MAG: hypothetical protein IBX72_06430 [Nitrospirae bacterium]|jgi:ribosome-binding protein aMBF1 (putative translation factor)|nr:hypothetical protein [Nitrospirota bacterium]
MANARVVTYECELCGSEIVVTETMETKLSPIYCCGVEVTEIVSMGKKPAKPKKKASKKKVAKKKTATKKKSESKKKASKK